MSWDPQQYSRFAGQRLRPALDLIARIPIEHPRTVVDLGCGTGNVTRVLRSRWPDAGITGVDGSPQMLAEARNAESDIAWEQCDVAGWNPPAKFDLIFSNATLHWLDDHPALFARLCRNVAAGGALAVQMPRNFGAPSHALIHELALSAPWRDALGALLRQQPVLAPEAYYRLLAPHARSLDIWETEYPANPRRREPGSGVDQGHLACAFACRARAGRACGLRSRISAPGSAGLSAPAGWQDPVSFQAPVHRRRTLLTFSI